MLSNSIKTHWKSTKINQNPPKYIKIHANPSKSTEITRTCIKITSASARARAIHFYISSVCSFHMFDPAILIPDH